MEVCGMMNREMWKIRIEPILFMWDKSEEKE